jgi:hypothetical protein
MHTNILSLGFKGNKQIIFLSYTDDCRIASRAYSPLTAECK